MWDNGSYGSIGSLSELSSSYPYQLSLWEAYGTLYDFLIENLDLTIGKQRIAWGTADKLNQTDNLNPLDFQDPLDFGKRIPTYAVKATYYPGGGDWSLTGIWIPTFHPSLLPKGEFPLGFFQVGENFKVVGFQDTILKPKRNLENSEAALKIAGRLSDWDFSFSYFKGYDPLPLPDSISISTPFEIQEDSLTPVFLFERLTFPKVQIIGFDFSGEVQSVGIWGEFAYNIPEKFQMKQLKPIEEPPFQVLSDTTLLEDPYFKFTLGGDYTFKGGPYINLQWMHGFYTERGSDLQDYFVGRIEKKFLHDKLQIGLGFMYNVSDWDSLSNQSGYAVIPEITYWPSDNVEIKLGLFYLDGKGRSLFSAWKDQDQVYLRTTLSF